VRTVSHLALIGLHPALGVAAKIGNKATAQRVERHGACLAVAPRAIPARWVVVHTAVALVHAFDRAALDNSPAYGTLRGERRKSRDILQRVKLESASFPIYSPTTSTL